MNLPLGIITLLKKSEVYIFDWFSKKRCKNGPAQLIGMILRIAGSQIGS